MHNDAHDNFIFKPIVGGLAHFETSFRNFETCRELVWNWFFLEGIIFFRKPLSSISKCYNTLLAKVFCFKTQKMAETTISIALESESNVLSSIFFFNNIEKIPKKYIYSKLLILLTLL